MEDVEALCKRVIIINHGEIVHDGDLEQLLQEHIDSKQLEVTFKEPVEKSVLEKLGNVKEYTARRVVLQIPKNGVKKIATNLLSEFPVDDILINEINIEEVIRKIFEEQSK
jgi:ABC-2 type transport system ATP-binding protein